MRAGSAPSLERPLAHIPIPLEGRSNGLKGVYLYPFARVSCICGPKSLGNLPIARHSGPIASKTARKVCNWSQGRFGARTPRLEPRRPLSGHRASWRLHAASGGPIRASRLPRIARHEAIEGLPIAFALASSRRRISITEGLLAFPTEESGLPSCDSSPRPARSPDVVRCRCPYHLLGR